MILLIRRIYRKNGSHPAFLHSFFISLCLSIIALMAIALTFAVNVLLDCMP